MRAAATALLCLTLAGCVSLSSHQRMPLHTDAAAMREEVLKHVSIGMPLEEAKRAMEAHGFRHKDGIFHDYFFDPVPGKPRTDKYARVHGGFATDKIWYSREIPQSSWLQSLILYEGVDVGLIHDGERVIDIRIRYDRCCL